MGMHVVKSVLCLYGPKSKIFLHVSPVPVLCMISL
jgi:hypothetical protein